MKVAPHRIDILDKIALEAAIAQLSPLRQEIARMYWWEDVPLDEIGDVLGPKYRGKVLTGSAIRYHLQKISERLREILEV